MNEFQQNGGTIATTVLAIFLPIYIYSWCIYAVFISAARLSIGAYLLIGLSVYSPTLWCPVWFLGTVDVIF